MAVFLFLLLTISTIYSQDDDTPPVFSKRSMRYLKADSEKFAFPIDVCFPRFMGTALTSIKLECVEECSPVTEDGEEPECDRNVIAKHYEGKYCDKVKFTDRFTPADRRGTYPYNCYENEELDGEAINPEDYGQNYMIVRLSHGRMVTETVVENEGLDNETTVEKEVCRKDERKEYFRTIPAITNTCVAGYEGKGRNRRFYWYQVFCNDDAMFLERYENEYCNGTQTGAYPIYKPNGCDQRTRYKGHYWYSEVIKCSNPEFRNGVCVRKCYNVFVAIVVAFMIGFFNS